MRADTDIDNYISTFPLETQLILRKVRETIATVSLGLTEVISYGIPTFKLNGKNLIHFAAFTNHVGLYPGPSTVEHFSKVLKNYEVSKGTIKFQLSNPIPYELIREIAIYNVATIKPTKK